MSPPNRMIDIAVFDIDGVLADVRHRLHFVAAKPKDWDAFFEAAINDTVLVPGRQAVADELALGRQIVYVTGRPQGCRQDTLEWLERHGFPQGHVHMRRLNDRRPARLVKPELIGRLGRAGRVCAVYDDDAAVVSALRSAWPELEVTHVTWMDEPSMHDTLFTHDTLFAAQEQDGRT